MRRGLILVMVMCAGIGLMAVAFYATTHRFGLCAPSNPFCYARLKSDQGNLHIDE